MMNRFHYINKYIFLGYYNIPFIFELRCFIDWTYTQTSLDVYQWIKLNQILLSIGGKPLHTDKALYAWYDKRDNKLLAIISTYVDDLR